jgi:lipopolysaccharide cholinephosphotransferase
LSLSTGTLFKNLSPNGNYVELSISDKKALQQVLALMLKDIVGLCERYHIEWCVCGGVCLGAVRHKGFIPWDDDLDIFVSRKDIPILEQAVACEFPNKYKIKSPQTSRDYCLGIFRIVLNETRLRGRDDFTDDCGVFCDIFVLEDAPQSLLRRYVHGFGSLCFGLIQSSRRFAEHSENYAQVVKGNPEAEKSVSQKVRLGKLFGFRSAEAWTKSWDKWNSKHCGCKSEYISCPAGRKHYFGELYKRKDFFPVSYGEFEGIRVPLPANPDAYLTALYGADYMTPPPENERESHVVLEFDLGKYDPRKNGPAATDAKGNDCGGIDNG